MQVSEIYKQIWSQLGRIFFNYLLLSRRISCRVDFKFVCISRLLATFPYFLTHYLFEGRQDELISIFYTSVSWQRNYPEKDIRSMDWRGWPRLSVSWPRIRVSTQIWLSEDLAWFIISNTISWCFLCTYLLHLHHSYLKYIISWCAIKLIFSKSSFCNYYGSKMQWE